MDGEDDDRRDASLGTDEKLDLVHDGSELWLFRSRMEASRGVHCSCVVVEAVDGPAAGSYRGRREAFSVDVEAEGMLHLVKRATAPVLSILGMLVGPVLIFFGKCNLSWRRNDLHPSLPDRLDRMEKLDYTTLDKQ